MSKTEVLIVGAGPTGLNLALRLARCGIDFRIVDKADGPGEASRDPPIRDPCIYGSMVIFIKV